MKLRAFLLWLLPELFFSGCRWYRRLRGGHWEQWYVDVVHSDVWHHVPRCSHETGDRPTSICRGTPICEEHPS